MKYQNIFVEKEKHLARVVISRPPLNILDIATLGEMSKAFATLEKEKPLLVVFSGEGENFSAGVEIKEHFPKTVKKMLSAFHGFLRRIVGSNLITCAAADGYVFGGGCELAAACDFIFATPKSVFAQPEAAVGCFPPFAAAYFPVRMGHRAAAELILEGKSYSAEEAWQAGLVNRVADDLDGEIWKLYEKLAHFSPAVLRLAKKALAGPKAGMEARLKHSENIYLRELVRVKDMTEGLNAFLQKRTPVWSGK
ncbi:MAG TPA: enoyl-CoA hydratase/isomerase family protein [Verrucomicrobiae bacterium]|nr:enoyl-CoA hydratase/isomerase family protein [Verrucomicrobiae bacterium]